MAMNKLMHPKNPYKTPPDFKKLALLYPEFRKYARQDLSGKVGFNFKIDGAVWALTKCLLKNDFDLDVETVPSHLVPTLPLRVNYILWICDILNLFKTDEQVSGIDIGTGACCIYPLIAAKRYLWNMTGTEVDEINYKCALENVQRNKLEDKIKVLPVDRDKYLQGVINDEIYDFCMCNPPFHDETDSNDNNWKPKSRTEDRPGPRNAHSGVNVELSTQGGEISFVKKIIDESIVLKQQIKVYTTMLGHKSSLGPLKEYIKKSCSAKISSTMFCQGRTTRWGLSWTFMDIDLDKADIQRLKKKKEEYVRFQDISLDCDCDVLATKIFKILDELKIEYEHTGSVDDVDVYIILARHNTWINNRKKRREEQRKHTEEKETDESPCKKIKLETTDEIYVKCSMGLKKMKNSIRIEMILIEGTGGKDALNQLLQFLKNHVKND